MKIYQRLRCDDPPMLDETDDVHLCKSCYKEYKRWVSKKGKLTRSSLSLRDFKEEQEKQKNEQAGCVLVLIVPLAILLGFLWLVGVIP